MISMIKPQTSRPRINWNNPLSRGLIAVFACNEGAGSLLNLVDMTTKLSLINSGAWTIGPIGAQLDCSQASDSGAQNTTPPVSMQPAKAVSILWQGIVNSGPSNSSEFAAMTYTNSDSSPYLSYSIGVSGLGLIQTEFNADGVYEFCESNDSITFNGVERQYLATIKSGTQALYENGALLSLAGGSNTTTFTNITYSANCRFNLGLYQNASGRNSKSKCSLCYVWNRVVSAREANLLYINPLQILFKPKTNLLFSSN